MPTPRRTPAADRNPEDWGRLIVSAGLASAILSGAGVVNEWLAARQQRCLLSQQIVGDETPNPALNLNARQELAAQASWRLRQCVGDSR
jgi:hypothetical protein